MPQPDDTKELPGTTYEEVLAAWENAVIQARDWTTKERELRLALFGGACPTPKEGTNNITLADGRICKFTHTINRKISNPVECRSELVGVGVNDLDKYVKPKYELAVGEYKKAAPNIREVLDRFVTSTPGLPTLKVE
jgi:hypothetical protein